MHPIDPWGISRRHLLRAACTLAAAAPGLLVGRSAFGRSLLRERVDEAALSEFSRRHSGRVLLPVDPAFENARRVASFNPRTDQRPALIAYCADADDVARTLEFGRTHALAIAVRSGGHDVLGQSTCEGGVLIDFADRAGIAVDADAHRVILQPGARSGHVDARMREHGRVVALGCNPAVGVAGLTLGGGLGWFIGKHGAACDHLLEAEVVTVDGRILRVSEDRHPDLFWALQGGGGNFGIVTELTLRSHAQADVTGGLIAFPGERLADFLRFYREYMAAAPDELAVEMFQFRPQAQVMFVSACHAGDPEAARKALAPLQAFATPLAGGFRNVPYGTPPDDEVMALMQRAELAVTDRPAETGASQVYWKGCDLAEVSDAAIDAIVGRVAEAPEGYSIGIGHYQHGAVCRPGADASALPRRRGTASLFFNTGWRGQAAAAANMRWVDDSIAALAPHASAGTYVNYLSDGSPQAVQASYGDRYPRLRHLKQRYDPDNVLRLNRNILPEERA
jgi:FAD/FMN-containing dehydrogenase